MIKSIQSVHNKLGLLGKATSDDDQPTPGYMFTEISKITFESSSQCQDVLEWLNEQLACNSCHTKRKVLRIMRYLIANGHPQFQQSLRRSSRRITEATMFSGPPDPLHGNALYLAVRKEAKELSEVLFMVSEDDANVPFGQPPSSGTTGSGMGSSSSGRGRMQGFGNVPETDTKSLGDELIGGLRDLATRVNSIGKPNTATFVVPESEFSGYRPAKLAGAEPTIQSSGVSSAGKESSDVRPPTRKPAVVRRKGVAGGGWEDDDTDVKSTSERHPGSSPSNSVTSGNHSTTEKIVESSQAADWSSERQLVADVVNNNVLIPTRAELNKFITMCSGLNCDKVVEFLHDALDPNNVILTTRSLVVIECLLRSDIVSVDHVAMTCHGNLLMVYESQINEALTQKARKIILILEKLSPRNKDLFARLRVKMDDAEDAVNGSTASGQVTMSNDSWTVSERTSESSDVLHEQRTAQLQSVDNDNEFETDTNLLTCDSV